MGKTWFVTGGSRGIGAEIVRSALAAGDRVAATGRDADDVRRAFGERETMLPLRLDVTDRGEVAEAVAAVMARFGRIDVVVNNAGYGQYGVFEETTPEDAEQQLATNVFGVLNVTRAVLPIMRAQRSGHIINMSSMSGMRGNPGGSLYCASKFALEGFSESLAREVEAFGIKVTLVEPGVVRTNFLARSSSRADGNAIPDYAELWSSLAARFVPDPARKASDPAKIGAMVVDLAGRDSPPERIPAGSDSVAVLVAKIARLQAELDATRALAVATDE